MIHGSGIYYYEKDNRINKRGSFSTFLIIASIILSAGACIYLIGSSNITNPKEVAGANTKLLLANPTPYEEPYKEGRLKQVIEEEIGDSTETIGMAVLNLKTGEYYLRNEDKEFKAASLYKLWVMAEVFDQMNRGELKEKDVYTENLASLYKRFNLASPSAQKSEDGKTKTPVVSLTVKEALEKMITVSDNDSALLLTAKMSLPKIDFFLNKYGFSGSKLGNDKENPTTTPVDVALFLKRLYGGKLIDEISSDAMLELLRRQRLNNKIPKYLPGEIIVAHKTGELDEVNHDAGIVYSPGGDYIIVIMTKGDPADRAQVEEKIAELSKIIYNYFNE